ncbi:hypothetical protein E0H62_14905 [Rhizobium leguminosarum bv. viciae]|nr:hypothetical protein E0H62_14905 [Rhizobium leguminosarum bv. viciae]
MIFSLEVRQARKGDCLLLHFGTEADRHLILIDGGPKGVYQPSLKPRLQKLAKDQGGRLPVDILMVSHVDDDHIQGILDLTREELELKDANAPRLLNVLSFWHNAFDEMVDAPTAPLKKRLSGHLGEAAFEAGVVSEDKLADIIRSSNLADEEVVEAGVAVLASIPQGSRLRGEAETLEWIRNVETDGEVLQASKKPIDIGELKLQIAGPRASELSAFRKKYQQWLKETRETPKGAAVELAAYVDESVTNLSSIVVLVESEKKRILLTGDARGDMILKGLEETGVIKPKGTLAVDILKVPHHGSSNNLDADFFERIIADHYVFSGNGEHGNPERETMVMLVTARAGKPITIHLTYDVSSIDVERKKEWAKQRKKEIDRKAENPTAPEPRADWSDKVNGLASYLDSLPSGTVDLRVVGSKHNHIIDLLDQVAY